MSSRPGRCIATRWRTFDQAACASRANLATHQADRAHPTNAVVVAALSIAVPTLSAAPLAQIRRISPLEWRRSLRNAVVVSSGLHFRSLSTQPQVFVPY